MSTDNFQNLVYSYPRRVKAVIAEKGNQLLVPMVLEWDTQQAHKGVMVWFPHTFGHIVHIIIIDGHNTDNRT